MRWSIRAQVVACAAWLAAAPASAVLVPVDLFAPGDELATYDSESGLAWLDLDQTVGINFDQIAEGAGGWAAQGWRPATTSEVCGLLNAHIGTLDPCPQILIPDIEPTPEVDTFIDLFEASWTFDVERTPGVFEPARESVAYFMAGENELGLAAVLDRNAAFGYYGHPNRAMFFAGDGYGPTSTLNIYALFLVRPLPEPAAALSLAAGCGALAALAHRRRPA